LGNQNDTRFSTSASLTAGSISHIGLLETLTMDKYHLLWVIERMLDKRSIKPPLEWAFIPASMCLGLIIALVTSDPKDALGTPKDVWHAVFIILTLLTVIASILLFAWWFYMKATQKERTPEDVVNEIMDQMARDRARLATMALTDVKVSNPPSTTSTSKDS
jgi:uncharacterized protein YacL